MPQVDADVEFDKTKHLIVLDCFYRIATFHIYRELAVWFKLLSEDLMRSCEFLDLLLSSVTSLNRWAYSGDAVSYEYINKSIYQ